MRTRATVLVCLGVAGLASASLAIERCDPLALRAPEGSTVSAATGADSVLPPVPSRRMPRLANAAANRWESFTPFPIGFSCPTMILDPVRDRLMVFAGTGWSGPSDDVFVRPADGSGAWERLEIDGPRPGAHMGGGAFHDPQRDRMVVFGGVTTLGVWALELAGEPRWLRLDDGSGAGPANRLGTGIVYDPVGDRLIMFGGHASGNQNDVWAFALGDASGWTQIFPDGTPPSPRAWQSVVLDSRRNRLLVFGGEGIVFNEPNADLWALTLDGAPRWDRLEPTGDLPPVVRQSSAAYDPVRDRLVIHGGWNPGRYELDDLWVLPLEGPPVWQRVALDPRPPVRACGYMVHDAARDRMVQFGGIVPDLWALDLESTPRWTNWDPGEPSPGYPRYAAAAAWDPIRAKALLFGGQEAFVVKGYRRYHLADLREWRVDRYSHWDAGTHPDAPTRGSAAMIVDAAGERLITFGGLGEDGPSARLLARELRDGAPWQEMAAAGEVPAARRNASLVLDPVRRRAILFGGRGANVLGDTWILALDGPPTWQRLDVAAPEPRFGHAMAYDPIGDRVLLFGGQGVSGALSDAWQLSLEPPHAWTPVPTARLPGPLGFPSLVVDTRRNRLVLVGGRDAEGLAHGETWLLPLAPEAAWSLGVGEAEGPGARWAASAVYDPQRDRVDIVYGTRNPCGEWTDWQLASGASLGSDDPAAPLVESLGTHAEPGRISLRWRVVPAAVVRATLQRRGAAGWETRATALSGPDGLLSFDERDAPAFSDASYRVVVSDGRFAAASAPLAVHVPRSAFALRGVNQPSSDGIVVELAFADATGARLEILDVSGRRIRHREVGGLGPRDHLVRLAAPGELPPGVYLVRLLRAGESRVARVAVTH